MTRLKLCLHLTSQARRAREMQLCHPALLDPAASPDVPTPPSGLVQAPAHIAGCDGAQHAGSAAPMVPRACSWPHWWPRLAAEACEGVSAGIAAEAAGHFLLHLERPQVALGLVVVEGNRQVVQEGEHRVLAQP